MAGHSHAHVLTEVRAMVDPSQHGALVAGFEALLREPRPDGLLRTELLQAGDEWRIQTLWRDHDALAAMRAGAEPPAAPRLFRSIGAEPQLVIFEVKADAEA